MDNQETPLKCSDDEDNFPISAIFPDGDKKEYSFNKRSTVANLVYNIMNDEDIKKPKDKHICVMYHGRILKPSEKFSEIDTISNYAVSIIFRLNTNAAQAELEQLGDEPELRGFDRLVRMDYSQQQISEIRHQFHFMRGGLDDSQEQQLDAEEEWLPVIFNNENPLETFQAVDGEPEIHTQNVVHHRHTNYDTFHFEQNSFWVTFSIALVLGFLFGPLSLLYLLVSLNDKPGILGIITGISIHFLLSKVFGVALF